MKNISAISGVLALVGVLMLFGLHFSRGEKKTAATGSVTTEAAQPGVRVAFVNIDSFEANYIYLKTQREAFNKKQESMSAELERSARQLQANIEEFQQKAQSGSITQTEGEAMEKKLIQMQQSLQLREQSLTEELLREKETFNNKLHEELDAFLTEYNKDKEYDYILSYSRIGSPILYASSILDITADVIYGMNERSGIKEETIKKK